MGLSFIRYQDAEVWPRLWKRKSLIRGPIEQVFELKKGARIASASLSVQATCERCGDLEVSQLGRGGRADL